MWRSSSPQFFGAALYEPTKMPEKLQLTYLSTSEQTEAMKEEIRDKIASLRDKLNSLECELLAQVDNLAAEQESEVNELKENLTSLKTVKASLLATKCSEDIKSSLAIAVEELDYKMRLCSQKLLQYTNIESTWNLNYWDSLSELCKLSNVKITGSIYQSKNIPKWQICKGSSPSQLQYPVSLAIQSSTGNIFVSDMKGMRIQVFSPEGKHSQLSCAMKGPFQLFSVDLNYLYAFKANQIFELKLKSINATPRTYSSNVSLSKVVSHNDCYFSFTDQKQRSQRTYFYSSEGFRLSTFSQPQIFGPEATCSSTSVNLVERNFTSLHIVPLDIAFYKESIFLLSGSNNLVHEFDSKCVFIRSFISVELYSYSHTPNAMCIDREGNIIITGNKVQGMDMSLATEPSINPDSDSVSVQSDDDDNQPIGTTKVFVLTQNGEFIIQEMDVSCGNCIGVAVNSDFDIFLLTKDNKHILTAL